MRRSIKKTSIGLVLLLAFFSASAWSVQDPQVLVEETTQKIQDALKLEHEQIQVHPARLYEIVDEIVLPHFDFRRDAELQPDIAVTRSTANRDIGSRAKL